MKQLLCQIKLANCPVSNREKNANSQLLKNFFERRSFLCERGYLLNKIVHDKQFNVIMQGQNKGILSHIKEKDF